MLGLVRLGSARLGLRLNEVQNSDACTESKYTRRRGMYIFDLFYWLDVSSVSYVLSRDTDLAISSGGRFVCKD